MGVIRSDSTYYQRSPEPRRGWKAVAYVGPYGPGTRQRKRRRDERRRGHG